MPGQGAFPAGAASEPVVIIPYDDSHGKGDESVEVTLKSPVGMVLGALTTHTITLAEASRPVLGMAAFAPSGVEGTGSATFGISRLGGPVDLAVIVR